MLFELTLHNAKAQFDKGSHAECGDEVRVISMDESFVEQKYSDAFVI
jgi:hypothetical protein